MASSIREKGLLTDLLVRRNSDPDVEALWDLIGGHRRYLALERLYSEGWEGRFSVKEITCSDQELVLFMAIDNMDRKNFSPIEEDEVVVRLERMGWTDDEIHKRMGRSLPWILERRALYNASPDVKDEVRAGLSASVAADIAKSGDDAKQAKVLAGAKEDAKKMAEEASRDGKKGKAATTTTTTGRKNWRQNMRSSVSKQTGKKMRPGLKLLRQVQQELVEGKILNGASKKALMIFDLALGEITVEKFRDEMGYALEDDAK